MYAPQKKLTNSSNSVLITPKQIEETIEADVVPTSLKVKLNNRNTVSRNGENKKPTVKYLKVVAYKKEILVNILKYEQFDTNFL